KGSAGPKGQLSGRPLDGETYLMDDSSMKRSSEKSGMELPVERQPEMLCGKVGAGARFMRIKAFLRTDGAPVLATRAFLPLQSRGQRQTPLMRFGIASNAPDVRRPTAP